MEKYSIFLVLAFVSEIVGTISGFGSSILFVPMASLFFDFKSVLGITAVFHVFSNLSKIALFKKGINKEIVVKLGLPAVLFVILGAFLTSFLSTNYIELGMNIALLFVSVYLIFNVNKEIRQSNRNLVIGGIVSGFLAGVTGTGGAIRGITLSAFQLAKETFIATSALIDLGVDSSRAVVYISQGYFKKEFIILIPFLIGISILGTFLGKKILKYTSEKTFRYIVLVVVLVTTAIQLLKYFK
jgi:uncharacterized protein